jgi:hypothetical protein
MSNLEILREIDKEIEICKEKIHTESAAEIKVIISNIGNLIEQYQPINAIQLRIIENRNSDVTNLKKTNQNTEEKNKISNVTNLKKTSQNTKGKNSKIRL